jgi:hypothetical protein
MDDFPNGLTLARWREYVSREPQYVPEGCGCPDRWSIMASDACLGYLDWNEDPRAPGKPGYLVVAAGQQHSHSVSKMAEALADKLGAKFQPCSARFSEIEELAEHVGTQPVEIDFDDGKTLLAVIDYCSLRRNEERLYYYNLDPASPSHGEGLCFTRIGSIRSIRPSDLRPPEGGSQG